MGKSYLQSAEPSSAFLNPVPLQGDEYRKGERKDTAPFREARFINIERIKPDPDQPRKNFDQDSLECLAESIRELGEIIDPLTVEYDEKEDIFRILKLISHNQLYDLNFYSIFELFAISTRFVLIINSYACASPLKSELSLTCGHMVE